MKQILKIKNLTVGVDEKKILNNLSLEVTEGEIHAILGPNGNGKSTLLQTIMGNKNYNVSKGSIYFNNKNIITLDPNERAELGIFMTFQNPVEIEGVLNIDFLRNFININSKQKTNLVEFYNKVLSASKNLKLPHNYLERQLNFGFSGGEKKINELLQLKLRNPKLALIDEIDSGLDVDSIKVLSSVINDLHKDKQFSAIIISHYDELYKNIKVTKFHVMIDGNILCSGDNSLLKKIQSEGFDWVYLKYNIKKPHIEQTILESCAIPKAK